MNLLYFGAIAAGMALTLLDPQLQATLLRTVVEAFSPTGSLGPLVQAYETGQLLPAIVLTFLVNLVLASGIFITLPSTVFAAYNALTGADKEIVVYPYNGHEHGDLHQWVAKTAWLRERFSAAS